MTVVLIADDEPRIRLLLRRILQAEGYEVVEAADGAQAVAELQTHRPSVVVLDVQMPGRNGLEVCRAVRADDALAGTGVIVASANGMAEDRSAAVAAGADLYITKPFSPSTLLAAVAELSTQGGPR